MYKRQVLGHNGSDKSTLAKTLNGVLLPCGGHVYVEGMDTLDEHLLLAIRRTAVSYTHLDVYKRQSVRRESGSSTRPGQRAAGSSCWQAGPITWTRRSTTASTL